MTFLCSYTDIWWLFFAITTSTVSVRDHFSLLNCVFHAAFSVMEKDAENRICTYTILQSNTVVHNGSSSSWRIDSRMNGMKITIWWPLEIFVALHKYWIYCWNCDNSQTQFDRCVVNECVWQKKRFLFYQCISLTRSFNHAQPDALTCTTERCSDWARSGKLRGLSEGSSGMVAFIPQQRHPSIVCFGGRPLTGKRLARKGLRRFIGSRSMLPLSHVAMNKWIRGELNINFTKEKESCALNPTPRRLKCCMTLR